MHTLRDVQGARQSRAVRGDRTLTGVVNRLPFWRESPRGLRCDALVTGDRAHFGGGYGRAFGVVTIGRVAFRDPPRNINDRSGEGKLSELGMSHPRSLYQVRNQPDTAFFRSRSAEPRMQLPRGAIPSCR